MTTSRSRFYVDTPPSRDPPSQRHSMFVSQSEVDRSPKQDLSSASSSATLPSTAGSVDRLTGLGHEKKTPRFFTLKPKTSFSLRPFFSSTSIVSPKRHRKSGEATTSRRDSYSQTDAVEGRAYDEVGVQTLNASTVDVPVQTCFREWEEGDIYSYRRRPISSAVGSYRPTFPRWPTPGCSSSAPPTVLAKIPTAGSQDLIDNKTSLVAPLVPTKVLKYTAPGDSAASEKTPVCTSRNVGIGTATTSEKSPGISDLFPTSVPVDCSSDKDPTGGVPYPQKAISDTSDYIVPFVTSSSSDSGNRDLDLKISSHPVNVSNTPVASTDTVEHTNDLPEVSNVLTQSSERPPSALKIDRTDSPVKLSSKTKTVHFVLSDSPKSEEISNPRDIDKDFEALLQNLGILTDEGCDSANVSSLKSPTSPISECPPKQTLLATNFKSFFDVLNHDVLPPILENVNEVSEADSRAVAKVNESEINKVETSSECDSKTNTLASSPVTTNVDEVEGDRDHPSSSEHDRDGNKLDDCNDDSVTSLAPFTSSKLDLHAENVGKRENVYDCEIKENNLKSAPLPILPSFFDSHSKSILDQVVREEADSTAFAEPLTLSDSGREGDEAMLSRSSSRSSMRSNSRVDINSFPDIIKRFDSCENLAQLEEEIIRSLCTPTEERMETISPSFVPHRPVTSEVQSVGPSQMRRAILDRLLGGEGAELVPNSGCNLQNVDDVSSFPENELNMKQGKKHTATLMKLENQTNNIGLDSFKNPEHGSSNTSFNARVASFNNISNFDNGANSEIDKHANSFERSGRSSISFYPTARENDFPKNTSVFLFPESNHLNAGVPEQSAVDARVKAEIFPSPPVTVDNTFNNYSKFPQDVAENDGCSGNINSTACDFTNCLRPSRLQNSPFFDKISVGTLVRRPSPDMAYVQTETTENKTPSKNAENKATTPSAKSQCDYGNCLKPSQVQNSIFTAELSEITTNKSLNFNNDMLRTNSPFLISRTNSPVTMKPDRPDPTPAKKVDEERYDNEVNHTSQATIILQTPHVSRSIPVPEDRTDEINSRLERSKILVTPAKFERNEPQTLLIESSPPNEFGEPPVLKTSSLSIYPSLERPEMNSFPTVQPPPPPPPPPPGTKTALPLSKNTSIDGTSLESMIRDQKTNLVSSPESLESKSTTPETPVLIELKKRFETHKRKSPENQHTSRLDRSKSLSSELLDAKPNTTSGSRSENINGSSFIRHSPYPYNENNGYSPDQRDRVPYVPNGRSEHSFNRRDQSLSPNTIITDEPPPPGAVLVNKKITVEGDKVHTDRYYTIPIKEVLKEKTSTTTFISAPPKYEGIGPTEDGIPIAPRQSVKKENMHNWYKTMFKSLHKADSANDSQDYIIGYSSEPETSKKEKAMRKKSSTLNNRHNASKTAGYSPGYPASARSSIEVYNVRPRLIEDYEPGHSSVTDDELVIGSKRYLPSLNTPKPKYVFNNGYEQDNNFIKKAEQPEKLDDEEQKVWYKEIQRGGDIPQFGLGKPIPEKPKDPVIGPLPPPPLNYYGPTVIRQATRPLTLPVDYTNQNENGFYQQTNGAFEVHMRHAVHNELQQRISPASSQLSSPSRSMLRSPSRTPDLKIPARALFDFKPESSKEIILKKGDFVLILRQLDKNWYEGEHQGRIGIFPTSYVEIVPPEHVSATSTTKSFIEGVGKVLFDFTAQTPMELSVRKGDTVSLLRRVDANWFEARIIDKRGIIPASYLQVLQEPSEKSIFAHSPKSCLKSPRSSSETRNSPSGTNSNFSSPFSVSTTSSSNLENGRVRFRGKKGSSLIEPVLYKAIYSYNPQNTDELELLEGDTIYVVEMCDDGWYVGTSVRTGIFGIFPGNYVERV